MSKQDLEKLALYKLKMDYYKAKIDNLEQINQLDQTGGYSGTVLFLYFDRVFNDNDVKNFNSTDLTTAIIDDKLHLTAYYTKPNSNELTLVKSVLKDAAEIKLELKGISNENKKPPEIIALRDEEKLTLSLNNKTIINKSDLDNHIKMYINKISEIMNSRHLNVSTIYKKKPNRYLLVQFNPIGKNNIIDFGKYDPDKKIAEKLTSNLNDLMNTASGSASSTPTTSGTTSHTPSTVLGKIVTNAHGQVIVPILDNYTRFNSY